MPEERTAEGEEQHEELTPEDIKREAIEGVAQKKGWVPKEQFKGDQSRWTDAETWLLNAATPNEMGKLAKEVTFLKDNIIKVREHAEKRAQTEIEAAKRDLKEQRKVAIKEADVEQVEELDKQIAELDKSNTETGTANRTFEDWKEKNDWYGADEELTAIADEIADIYDTLPVDKLLKKVDAAVKLHKKAPEKEPEKERTNASETNATKTRTGGAKKYTMRDLSDEQRDVCKVMVSTIPGMTAEKYIQELAEMGELK